MDFICVVHVHLIFIEITRRPSSLNHHQSQFLTPSTATEHSNQTNGLMTPSIRINNSMNGLMVIINRIDVHLSQPLSLQMPSRTTTRYRLHKCVYWPQSVYSQNHTQKKFEEKMSQLAECVMEFRHLATLWRNSGKNLTDCLPRVRLYEEKALISETPRFYAEIHQQTIHIIKAIMLY